MVEVGKFFLIKSQLNGLVLEIENGIATPGQKVVMGRSHGGQNQIWYEDPLNQCIRSRSDDNLCLHVQGDELVVTSFEPDEYNQRWRVHNDRIVHCEEADRCLDITENNEDEGAPIGQFDFHGGDNQLWSFEHLPPQYCYIKSQMNGYVIDVRKADTSVGAKLVMYSKQDNDNDNQIFWEDKYGYIHSKLTGYVCDSSEGSVCMKPYDPTIATRKWIKCGQKIVLKDSPEIVLDIKGASNSKGAKLCGWEYKAADNQHWIFEYI